MDALAPSPQDADGSTSKCVTSYPALRWTTKFLEWKVPLGGKSALPALTLVLQPVARFWSTACRGLQPPKTNPVCEAIEAPAARVARSLRTSKSTVVVPGTTFTSSVSE